MKHAHMNIRPMGTRTSFYLRILLMFFFVISAVGLSAQTVLPAGQRNLYPADILTGAQQTDVYFPWLRKKNVAVVANPTSLLGPVHLVDSLVHAGIRVRKVFCPEHGFRGTAEAGARFENGHDSITKLPLVSLYGQNYKPSPDDLKDIDVVIFDLQDVGVRFYTYISTLHYLMEACAENDKTLIVLDRPNPNGHYVDGPVLDTACRSFVGVDPLPIVHGLTVAEYARMVNGEYWLHDSLQCELRYVPVKQYSHRDYYYLPVRPSPNLPNMAAVWLYPSLCLFEGTVVSLGRGTDKPFQQYGHPRFQQADIRFTPHDIPGVATNPVLKDSLCYGYDLTEFAQIYIKTSESLYLFWLLDAYQRLGDQTFFTPFFNRLAGTPLLKEQIIKGATEEEIRTSWKEELMAYKALRKKYLLYPDFE